MRMIILICLSVLSLNSNSEPIFPLLNGTCEEVKGSLGYVEPSPDSEDQEWPSITFDGHEGIYLINCHREKFKSLLLMFVTVDLNSSKRLYEALLQKLTKDHGKANDNLSTLHGAVNYLASGKSEQVRDSVWGVHTNQLHLSLNYDESGYFVVLSFGKFKWKGYKYDQRDQSH